MKKVFLLLAAVGATFASCQKSNVDPSVDASGQATVTFLASLPSGGIKTYANTSQGGVAANIDFTSAYDIRYILEVYDGTTLVKRVVQAENDPSTGTTITTRLTPKAYRFVFWADIVPQGAPANLADYHYNTTSASATLPDGVVAYGLNNVTLITSSNYSQNDDTRDAYTFYQDINVTGSLVQPVVLTRPLGKVRIVATDVDPSLIPAPAQARLVYGGVLPIGFNAFSASTIPASSGTPLPDYTSSSPFNNVADELGTGTLAIAWDYVFTSASENAAYNIGVVVSDASNNLIKNSPLSTIPLERNKLTTVKGNFFSAGVTFSISVNPAFSQEIVTQDISAIQAALNAAVGVANYGSIDIAINNPVTTSAGVITIPAYDVADVPSVTFTFSGGITSPGNISFQGSYTGAVNFVMSGPVTGINALSIDLPSAQTTIQGPLASFRSSLAVSNASSVTWAVGTMNDLSYALYVDPTATHAWNTPWNVPYNKGVVLTADILNCNSRDPLTNGEVANQQPINLSMPGYVFDGQGHTLMGSGRNNIILISANNVTLKNVTVTNTNRNGITLYNVTGAILDGVSTINNGSATGSGVGVVCNSSTIALLKNFTSSGNAWNGGINLAKTTLPAIPSITAIAGTIAISDAAPIYADFDIAAAGLTPAQLFNFITWSFTQPNPALTIWKLN